MSYVIEFDCESQAFERDRVRKCSEDALDGRMFEFVKSKSAQMAERRQVQVFDKFYQYRRLAGGSMSKSLD